MLLSQQVIDNVLSILNSWMNRSCLSNCFSITVFVLHGKEKSSQKLTLRKTSIQGSDRYLVVTLLFQCEVFLHMTKFPDN